MDDIPQLGSASDARTQAARFQTTRDRTERLAAGLSPEDQCVQSMPDASPAKWHRAHTTWFFEQFVLVPHLPGYTVFDEAFCFLFNSYYDAVGARHPRPIRGLLTRPDCSRVTAYRCHVDGAMARAFADLTPAVRDVVELGIQHEQQHQELLLTDTLHAFSMNPLAPAMLEGWREPPVAEGTPGFLTCSGGIARIGYAGNGFHFDNEGPAHQVLLHDYAIGSHLVRNAAYRDFIADGGYSTSALWMSDGWATVQLHQWQAPLHWRRYDNEWMEMTLAGLRPLDPNAPVRHISWYEADAFARWADGRLPTEAEWEAAAQQGLLREADSHVWQWTDSAYRPYPGFKPVAGAIGEYNGKFMINQMVLRGGSLATPPGHARLSYRNFFHPDKRWQFSGLRLARDI